MNALEVYITSGSLHLVWYRLIPVLSLSLTILHDVGVSRLLYKAGQIFC